MPRHFLATAFVAAALVASVPVSAQRFSGKFSGFNEVGALGAGETGAILSEGTGTIKLRLDRSTGTLAYELTYSGLSSEVKQSHIHFGRVHTAGGIMVFFCTNLGNGPAGTPACPATGGTVTGTLSAASVVAVPGQNVTAGDFDAITDALFADAAYANIHTARFPAGEIRAQVKKQHDDDDGDDK